MLSDSLSYIEQTSLKFHIETFIEDNIDEPYILDNYVILLSQNNKYIHFQFEDTTLPFNCNRISSALLKITYDFNSFLILFKYVEKQLGKKTN